jgi:8-oxo-dGTP diphosphatase
MIRYVVGFLFCEDDPDGIEVWLIRKQRPSWQRGKLNGIGGKVEPGESGAMAMTREFREETGLDLSWTHDDYFLTIGNSTDPKVGSDKPWRVDFFSMTVPYDTFMRVQTVTDEQCTRLRVRDLERWGVVPNLLWLIPLALSGATFTHDAINNAGRYDRAE